MSLFHMFHNTWRCYMKRTNFVKKYTILLLCLIIGLSTLIGCEKKELAFTMETYPKVDGSTVTIPLSEAVAATLTHSTLEAVRPYIMHNKTHQAYLNLIDKKVDLSLLLDHRKKSSRLQKRLVSSLKSCQSSVKPLYS